MKGFLWNWYLLHQLVAEGAPQRAHLRAVFQHDLGKFASHVGLHRIEGSNNVAEVNLSALPSYNSSGCTGRCFARAKCFEAEAWVQLLRGKRLLRERAA